MHTTSQRKLETKSREFGTKAAGDDFSAGDILAAVKSRDDEIKKFAGDATEKLSELNARLQEVEQKQSRASRHGGGAAVEQNGVGQISDTFSKSDQFEALKKGAPSTGRVAVENISLKAIVNAGQGVSGSTGYQGVAQRAPGLYNAPQPRLSLLEVLPSLPATSAVFEYMQLDTYSNNAAYQTEEGAAKAESNIEATPEQAQIATIAHFIKASKQVLDDNPALQQQISSLMNYGVLAKLEAELIGGVGGKGKIKGLNAYAVAYTAAVATGLKAADYIGQAVTSLNAAGWSAGLIILNPQDWFAIASERDSQGQYVLGSPRDPAPPALWGVPVVLSAGQPAGKALVLDPAQVAVLDREQPSVLASREDGSNFTSNLVTLLGELRAGLAVFATGAVLAVTLAPTK